MISVEIGHFFALEFLRYNNWPTIIWMVPAESQFPGLFKNALKLHPAWKIKPEIAGKEDQTENVLLSGKSVIYELYLLLVFQTLHKKFYCYKDPPYIKLKPDSRPISWTLQIQSITYTSRDIQRQTCGIFVWLHLDSNYYHEIVIQI